MARVTRLPAGGRERNDDVAELFGIRRKSRRKGQHIRPPVDVTELTIQRSDPRVGDERNREIAARPRRSDAAQPGCETGGPGGLSAAIRDRDAERPPGG